MENRYRNLTSLFRKFKKKKRIFIKKKLEKKFYASFGNNIKIIIYYKMKIIERAIA